MSVAALFENYIAAGFDPDGFWRITPREFTHRISGANERRRFDQDARAWLAWHTAALVRVEEMPDLSELLTPRKAEVERILTPDEQMIALDQLFLAMGGNKADLAAAHARANGG